MANRSGKSAGKRQPKGKQSVKVSMKDRRDGAVHVTYEFDPPVHAASPETPALKLGRKVIKLIEDSKQPESGDAGEKPRF